MPPKFKFTKEQIVDAAFALVRRNGWKALSTRSIAGQLGSSARPIYSFFRSMEELEEEIVKKAVSLLHEYMNRQRTSDPWHDHGIGYVLFAMEEKHLFCSINDGRHIGLFRKYGDEIWKSLTDSLSDYPPFEKLTAEEVYQVQLHRWLFAHGLAFSATKAPPDTWTPDNVIDILRSGSQAIYTGLLSQFSTTGKTPHSKGGKDGKEGP
jgi:AcrR family transcriptional regulator